MMELYLANLSRSARRVLTVRPGNPFITRRNTLSVRTTAPMPAPNRASRSIKLVGIAVFAIRELTWHQSDACVWTDGGVEACQLSLCCRSPMNSPPGTETRASANAGYQSYGICPVFDRTGEYGEILFLTGGGSKKRTFSISVCRRARSVLRPQASGAMMDDEMMLPTRRRWR